MNKIMLLGNLTKDPEIRSTSTGLKTCAFSLAINDGKDKNGQDQVQYFNCSCFDKQAELFEKYIKKGHKVMIVGRLKNESWDKPDGTKAYGVKVLVSEVEMLTSRADADKIASMPSDSNSSSTGSKSSSKKVVEDDLPEIDVNSMNVQMPF